MRTLIKFILLATFLMSTHAQAHSEGHGKVDTQQILKAAQKSAKILAFKDKGMSVGKLDSSWGKVSKDNFKVVEESDKAIIVKATNDKNNQTLYFTVNKHGKVMDVKEAKAFKHSHGHSH